MAGSACKTLPSFGRHKASAPALPEQRRTKVVFQDAYAPADSTVRQPQFTRRRHGGTAARHRLEHPHRFKRRQAPVGIGEDWLRGVTWFHSHAH